MNREVLKALGLSDEQVNGVRKLRYQKKVKFCNVGLFLKIISWQARNFDRSVDIFLQ